MEEYVKFVYSLLSKSSSTVQWIGVILFLPTIWFTYKFLNDKEFRTDILSLFSRVFRKKINLNNNELFSNKTVFYLYADQTEFKCKIKTEIFRIILKHQIDTSIEFCKKLIESKYDKDNHLPTSLMQLVIDISIENEIRIKKTLLEKYKEDADTLFTIIYENGYKERHNITLSYILKILRTLDSTNITKTDMIDLFIKLINISLDEATLDCEKTFDNLNGSLTQYDDKWYK